MLDRAENRPERDALRRAPMARTIYELISSGMPGEPLRIGIYGEWGEGKSTVLNFIEYFCHRSNIPVIWFNPWAAKDTASLWRSFSREVRTTLKTGRSWKELIAEGLVRGSRFSEWGLRLIARWKPWVAELLSLQKAIDAVAASLDRRRPGLDRASVDRHLKMLPSGRRIVVIIDDLDRAAPDVVPHLLLALREIFDVAECAFVIALDPKIVSKALPTVHPGWGTTGEFLEKIIQFPFWLPVPRAGDLLRLADMSLSELPVSVARDVVHDLIDLLPRNPRRLKQYFRNVVRLQAVIERHDPDELHWPSLLVVELMRAVAPTAAAELFHDEKFMKRLSSSTMMGRHAKDEYGEKLQKELDDALTDTCDRVGVTEPHVRAELRKVVMAVGERVGVAGAGMLEYWSRISEDPPIFTWREFRIVLEEWRQHSTHEVLGRAVEVHARHKEAATDAAMREFFQTAVTHRQRLLDQAANVNLAEELERFMREANEGLELIRQLSLDLSGFRGDSPPLGVEEFHRFYEHVARWAHFTNREIYQRTRDVEKQLLLTVGEAARSLAPGELERLQVYLPFREVGGQPEAGELYRALVEMLREPLFEELRRRFKRENGIGSLWGRERGLVQKYFLSRPDLGFYTAETREFLRHVADEAPADPAVQENFLEFLRLLVYGITDTLGVVTHEEIMPLAKDREVVGTAWKAGTARELQPRTIGSLEQSRHILAQIAETDQHLPLPAWWVIVAGAEKSKP